MKKILLTMAFVLTALGNVWADEMTVENITIPQQNSATLTISFSNSVAYRQLFSFKLELPEGITPVAKSQALSSRFGANGSNPELGMNRPKKEGSEEYEDYFMVVCSSGLSTEPMTGNSGEIMTVQLLADASLTEGTVLEGKISEIKATRADVTEFVQAEATFQITIDAPLEQVILDENSTETPESKSNVDVLVYRTIKANEWSTICLPFAMTGTQVVSTFGDDVKIAEFTSWSLEGKPSEANSINLTFTQLNPEDGMEANYPYMIKVSSLIEQFTLNKVEIYIDPDPDEIPCVSNNKKISGKNYSLDMNGNYVKKELDDTNFFVSENKFWKSGGNVTIKGFRCSFVLDDRIDWADGALSRMTMNFIEETTGIDAVNAGDDSSEEYYNLQGQRVDTPAKGVFIKGGKKILVK